MPLKGFSPPAGRGGSEQLDLPSGGTFTLLDDAYNANPESMRAGLAALSQRKGRRIAVLGEMKELGANTVKEHAELAGPLKEAGVDLAVLSGEGMMPLVDKVSASGDEPGVEYTSTAQDAINIVKNALRSGDVVLIKGSNASGMTRVGTALRQWCDDEAKGQMMGQNYSKREA